MNLLEARGVSMSFPGVRALDGVDFDVVAGEVHALIGENGAGKSTLVHILTGEIAADAYEGEVRLDGLVQRLATPREAIESGIAVIPQELQLVSTLSAAENIYLGREPRTALGLIDAGELDRRSAEELEAVGEIHARPAQKIERLEAGQRQLVAIARALSLDARLIIMDEPTASLGAEEAGRLERLVRRLCERGVAVVYISHKLDEVRRLANRVTVLRDGRRVATRDAAGLDEAEMVRLMVGREIPRVDLAPPPSGSPEILRVEGSVGRQSRPPGRLPRARRLAVGPSRRDRRPGGPRRRGPDGLSARAGRRFARRGDGPRPPGRAGIDGAEPARRRAMTASCSCPRSARRRRSSRTFRSAATSRSERSRK